MKSLPEEKELKRVIGLWDAVLLVVGSMIGSGIFIVSADITRHTGSAGWLMLVWVIGGVMTLIAALSYGELSGMYPGAGGQYVYLKEAYGPLTAFVYGWSLFAVIQTGTIAAVGVSFFKFLAYFFPSTNEDLVVWSVGAWNVSPAQLLAIGLIFFLTFIQTRGIRVGRLIQTVFTTTKIASIGGLILAGFILCKPLVWHQNWSHAWTLSPLYSGRTAGFSYSLADYGGALAAALVGAIMSYEAWNNVTFVAGEIRNPKKNIGLGLFIGTVLVALIYVALNLMFTAVLPLTDMAHAPKDRVGIAAATAIFRNKGTAILSLLILIATFGCNNGLILSGARVYYSMARDGLFFSGASVLNQNKVPATALWLQAIMASILCLSGKYGDLLDMITFVAVLFYVLTIAGIFVLRKKEPFLPRPYKAVGYPWLPVLYLILGSAFCLLLIWYKPAFTWPGLIIACFGIPVYFINKNWPSKRKGRPVLTATSVAP